MAAQYGSPLKRPSIAWSLPEAVAREVTAMSLMRIAIASPGSAPSTATGVHTSCPPRIDGVIIGPQQPGVEFHTMWPPSATGPSIGTSGPSRPSVKVSTRTVWRTAPVMVCASSIAMRAPCSDWAAAGHGQQHSDLVAVVQRVGAQDVAPFDHRQRRAQRRREVGVARADLPEGVADVRAVGQLERDQWGRGEA